MAVDLRQIRIADIGNALMLLAEVYTDARRALAEFVSNSSDAFDLCRNEGTWRDFACEIVLEERRGLITRITVKDNGIGIPYERLAGGNVPGVAPIGPDEIGSVGLLLQERDVVRVKLVNEEVRQRQDEGGVRSGANGNPLLGA